jgi:hypothetical protein
VSGGVGRAPPWPRVDGRRGWWGGPGGEAEPEVGAAEPEARGAGGGGAKKEKEAVTRSPYRASGVTGRTIGGSFDDAFDASRSRQSKMRLLPRNLVPDKTMNNQISHLSTRMNHTEPSFPIKKKFQQSNWL